MPSAAELVRAALVAAEIVVFPGVSQQPYDTTVQCFTGPYDSELESLLALEDTHGMNFSTDMRDGQADIHHGVRATARTVDYHTSGDIIRSVQGYFASLAQTDYNVRDSKMTSVRIYPHGTAFYVGEEAGTKRYLWALNLRVVMGQTTLEG